MLNLKKDDLENLKAINTVSEIEQQGELWQDVFSLYANQKNEIQNFLKKLIEKHGKLQVVFTGAGTSAYVGDILEVYLKESSDFIFKSIPTTDIVASPNIVKNMPTILVSFARSGNSPESLHAVKLLDQVLDNVYHLAITCASEGKLAVKLKNRDDSYVFTMPSKSNDKGFAMTGSFTCMLFASIMVFSNFRKEELESYLKKTVGLFNKVISKVDTIKDIIDEDFNRIVYLGSGVHQKLAREAQLKVLELTAGEIATCYESSMGFRHGPKSFVNEKTLVFDFVSTDEYTRQYDIDILNEVYHDKIAKRVVAITNDSLKQDFEEFSLDNEEKLEDIFLVFPYIAFAQIVSVLSSLKVGNSPDSPSATGTVNRVVKGVILHEFK
ncbi:MAG: SIS domain-containing protein [Peptoniphilaceae bacterium]